MKGHFFGAFLHWGALFYFWGILKMKIYRIAFIGHREIDEKHRLEAPPFDTAIGVCFGRHDGRPYKSVRIKQSNFKGIVFEIH